MKDLTKLIKKADSGDIDAMVRSPIMFCGTI